MRAGSTRAVGASRRAARSCTRAPAPRRSAGTTRRRDGHQPGARPQRADRRQVRRARLAARAGDDQHVAEVALVRVGGARPARARASAPRVSSSTRGPSTSSMHLRRNADVGDDDVAGPRLGRRQHQRQLRRAERHGERGLRCDSPIGSWRVGRQAARQIDRDDGNPRRVHVGDDRLEQSRRAARSARCRRSRRRSGRSRRDLREVQLPLPARRPPRRP